MTIAGDQGNRDSTVTRDDVIAKIFVVICLCDLSAPVSPRRKTSKSRPLRRPPARMSA